MDIVSRAAVRFAVLVAGIALLAAACGGGDDQRSAGPADTPEPTPVELGESPYEGVRVLPPIPKPDVVLTDTEGEPFDLQAETEGYLTLFYLGYTHCPDICPVHLLDIAATLREMDPALVAKVKVVFVTTDPERDTPEVLRAYLDHFDPRFIGLTGTQEELDALQRSLGIPPATKTDLGGGNYAVNHATYVMAFTTDNLAHIVYPAGVTRDTWAHDLPKLAEEGWTLK